MNYLCWFILLGPAVDFFCSREGEVGMRALLVNGLALLRKSAHVINIGIFFVELVNIIFVGFKLSQLKE